MEKRKWDNKDQEYSGGKRFEAGQVTILNNMGTSWIK